MEFNVGIFLLGNLQRIGRLRQEHVSPLFVLRQVQSLAGLEILELPQNRVIERLTRERYIDNERYARAFVKDKIRYNKWGRRKVQQALWMKRIDDDIQRRVLDEIDEKEYLDVLRPLLKQKRKSIKAASDYELNQKLVRFALGRGFGFDIIRQCLNVNDDDYPEDFTDETD